MHANAFETLCTLETVVATHFCLLKTITDSYSSKLLIHIYHKKCNTYRFKNIHPLGETRLHARNIRSEKREERALVVQATKKKNTCYFLGVGSKQGRLDLILPKFQK